MKNCCNSFYSLTILALVWQGVRIRYKGNNIIPELEFITECNEARNFSFDISVIQNIIIYNIILFIL